MAATSSFSAEKRTRSGGRADFFGERRPARASWCCPRHMPGRCKRREVLGRAAARSLGRELAAGVHHQSRVLLLALRQLTSHGPCCPAALTAGAVSSRRTRRLRAARLAAGRPGSSRPSARSSSGERVVRGKRRTVRAIRHALAPRAFATAADLSSSTLQRRMNAPRGASAGTSAGGARGVVESTVTRSGGGA